MLVSAELTSTVIHMSVFRKRWLSHSHTITVSPLSLLQPVLTALQLQSVVTSVSPLVWYPSAVEGEVHVLCVIESKDCVT